jgi:AraC-like DNA-binding protein
LTRIIMQQWSGRKLGVPHLTALGLAHSQTAQRLTWHSHAGWQVLFVLRGATAYEFHRGAGRRVDLPGRHFIVIPPDVVHRGVEDMRPPCDLFHLIINRESGRRVETAPFAAKEWRWLRRQLAHARLASYPVSAGLQQAMLALANSVPELARRSKFPEARARLRLLVGEVLLGVAEQLTRSTSLAPNQITASVEGYLRQHLGEPIRMSEVARQLGLSRARLYELFKRGSGQTPNDFLLRARVEKARELLGDTRQSLTDIALAAGFGSSQYFSTVFRKYTGQTPGDYRRSLGRGKNGSAPAPTSNAGSRAGRRRIP